MNKNVTLPLDYLDPKLPSCLCLLFSCNNNAQKNTAPNNIKLVHTKDTIKTNLYNTDIIVGAERLDQYLPLLKNKKVGLLVNHTSIVKNQHLVDVLIENNIQVTTIFAPEHGFRGTADHGANIKNGKDKKTGIPIVSVYGKQKKPNKRNKQEK